MWPFKRGIRRKRIVHRLSPLTRLSMIEDLLTIREGEKLAIIRLLDETIFILEGDPIEIQTQIAAWLNTRTSNETDNG